MVGVTAFAAFSFDDSIRNFFNIYDNQSQQTAEKLTTNVNASDESNGIRLDLTQTIGDHSGFYAVINASDLKDVPATGPPSQLLGYWIYCNPTAFSLSRGNLLRPFSSVCRKKIGAAQIL